MARPDPRGRTARARIPGDGRPGRAGTVAPGTGLRFGGESCWVDLGGPVHYLDYGGPAGAPVIVAVHGLEGCAVNWSAIAPTLTSHYRVLAPDLAGHGFTRSAGRGVNVSSNRSLLHRFLEVVAGSPVILMGNSMGGMISLREAATAPGTVAGLILLDPALPVMPVRPDPGRGHDVPGQHGSRAEPADDQPAPPVLPRRTRGRGARHGLRRPVAGQPGRGGAARRGGAPAVRLHRGRP